MNTQNKTKIIKEKEVNKTATSVKADLFVYTWMLSLFAKLRLNSELLEFMKVYGMDKFEVVLRMKSVCANRDKDFPIVVPVENKPIVSPVWFTGNHASAKWDILGSEIAFEIFPISFVIKSSGIDIDLNVLILTYNHECWIMNKKVRSRVQAAEMGFLRRISDLTLLDKVKSADIRESPNIESLLFRLEKKQLRWYGHVTRMFHERTTKKLLCSTPIGRRPRGRFRTRWRDYEEDFSWFRLGISAEHLSFVAEDRDSWRIQLELLPPRPPKDKRVQKID